MEYDGINKDEVNPNVIHVHVEEGKKRGKIKGLQHCP
jgi:hypothetical protein